MKSALDKKMMHKCGAQNAALVQECKDKGSSRVNLGEPYTHQTLLVIAEC